MVASELEPTGEIGNPVVFAGDSLDKPCPIRLGATCSKFGGSSPSGTMPRVGIGFAEVGVRGGSHRYLCARRRTLLENGRTTAFPYLILSIQRQELQSRRNLTFYTCRIRTVDDGSCTTQYCYDGAGDPVGRKLVSGAASYPTTFAYNNAGLATSMSSGIPSPSGSNLTTTWSYDQAGHRTSESEPNGESLALTYNLDDTLATHVLTSGASTIASWGYSYDNDYRVTDQTFSGTAGATGTLLTDIFHYAYDVAGRVSSFQKSSAAAETIAWDHDSNRTDIGASHHFDYQADDSIIAETKTGSPDRSYGYDPFGGMHSDGCFTYQFDGFDRTISATASGTGCSGSTGYTYDALDRQRSRTESGIGTTSSHYDGIGSSLIDETRSSGDVVYELGSRGEAHALKSLSDSAIEYLAGDGIGNVATVTDDSAAVKCTLRYSPFGEPQGSQSATICNTGAQPKDALFFKGAARDATTGAYQFGSRSYDPAKATFTTPDRYRAGPARANLSIGVDPLTRNGYAYVNGDPINLADPTGHRPLHDSSYDTGLTQLQQAKRVVAPMCARRLYEGAGVSPVESYSNGLGSYLPGVCDFVLEMPKDSLAEKVAGVIDAPILAPMIHIQEGNWKALGLDAALTFVSIGIGHAIEAGFEMVSEAIGESAAGTLSNVAAEAQPVTTAAADDALETFGSAAANDATRTATTLESSAAETGTGTVWDSISATQPVYEGTELPRSFVMNVGEGENVWVAPNASEHILERIGNVSGGLQPIQTQNMLSSLRSAVEAANEQGISLGKMTRIGGWEFMFDAPRAGELYPVLYHALYLG